MELDKMFEDCPTEIKELVSNSESETHVMLQSRLKSLIESSLDKYKVETEKEMVVKDNKYMELERNLHVCSQRLQTYADELRIKDDQLDDFKSNLAKQKESLTSSDDSLETCRREMRQFQSESERLENEKSSLYKICERRLEEVNRLTEELSSVKQELCVANKHKYDTIVKMEEVDSRDTGLQFREQRMQEERALLNNQINTLNLQLSEKNNQVMSVRSEQMSKITQLQSQLQNVSEREEYAKDRITHLEEENRSNKRQITELIDRLKEARECETKLEESFRQELSSQSNLAELYKAHADETESKANELSSAVEELQSLLKESSDRFGELECKYEREKEESDLAMERRNETIRGLKKQLDSINGGGGVGDVSFNPQILNSSQSQLYTRLVETQQEVIRLKGENVRLNTYLDNLLAEIEERGPVIKQQRDDYESALKSLDNVTGQLSSSKDRDDRNSLHIQNLESKCASSQREVKRLEDMCSDMSRQVTCLLRRIQMQTANSTRQQNINGQNSEDVDDMVTFEDVCEMQQRNIQLLALLRQHQSQNEQHLAFKQMEDSLLKQVEELKASRERQKTLVESVVLERDMYKQLVMSNKHMKAKMMSNGMSTSNDEGSSTVVSDNDNEASKSVSQEAFNKLTDEFREYRNEKAVNDKMSHDELKGVRDELSDSRAKIAKLTSQDELNVERLKTADSNCKMYRKEISSLEDSNKRLQIIIGKHEQTIDKFGQQVLECEGKLAQVNVQLQFATNERDVAKQNEMRTAQLNEMLQKQKSTSSMLLQDIQLIKLKMDQSEESKKTEMEEKVVHLESELSSSHERLCKQEQDIKNSIEAWESTRQENAKQIENLKLENLNLLKRLKGSTSTSETGPEIETASTDHSLPSVVLSSAELTDAKEQIKSLTIELESTRKLIQDLKAMSEESESRLKENNILIKDMESESQSRLDEKEDELYKLNVALEKARSKIDDLNVELKGHETDLASLNFLKDENVKLTEEIRLQESNHADRKAQLKEQNTTIDQFKVRYESELLLHAQAVRELDTVKAELKSAMDVRDELVRSRDLSEKTLRELKSQLSEREDVNTELVEKSREQMDLIQKENTILVDQLSSMSDRLLKSSVNSQLVQLPSNKSCVSSCNVAKVDANIRDEEKMSIAQLTQLVKYLKQEKSVLTSKMDIAQAESSRLSAKLAYLQKQVDNQLQAPSMEDSPTKNGGVVALPSSAYAEILQKVQTVATLTDSNQLLRESKVKCEKELEDVKSRLSKSELSNAPLNERIRELSSWKELKEIELSVLRSDNERWKHRSNQLIARSENVNKDELKRLVGVEAEFEKNQSELKNLHNLHQQNLVKITQMNGQLNEQNVIISSLTDSNVDLKQEGAEVKSKLEAELKAHGSDVKSYEDQVTALKSSLETKEEMEKNMKIQITRLKGLGRNYKEKFEKSEKDAEEVKKRLALVETQMSAKTTPPASTTVDASTQSSSADGVAQSSAFHETNSGQEMEAASSDGGESIADYQRKLSFADSLVEKCQAKIVSLELEMVEVEQIKSENTTLKANAESSRIRFKSVLSNAKEKVNTLKNENEDLKSKLAAPKNSVAVESIDLEEHERIVNELEMDRSRLESLVESLSNEVSALSNVGSRHLTTTPSSSSSSANVGGSSTSAATSSSSSQVQHTSVPLQSGSGLSGTGTCQPQQAHIQPTIHVMPLREAIAISSPASSSSTSSSSALGGGSSATSTAPPPPTTSSSGGGMMGGGVGGSNTSSAATATIRPVSVLSQGSGGSVVSAATVITSTSGGSSSMAPTSSSSSMLVSCGGGSTVTTTSSSSGGGPVMISGTPSCSSSALQSSSVASSSSNLQQAIIVASISPNTSNFLTSSSSTSGNAGSQGPLTASGSGSGVESTITSSQFIPDSVGGGSSNVTAAGGVVLSGSLSSTPSSSAAGSSASGGGRHVEVLDLVMRTALVAPQHAAMPSSSSSGSTGSSMMSSPAAGPSTASCSSAGVMMRGGGSSSSGIVPSLSLSGMSASSLKRVRIMDGDSGGVSSDDNCDEKRTRTLIASISAQTASSSTHPDEESSQNSSTSWLSTSTAGSSSSPQTHQRQFIHRNTGGERQDNHLSMISSSSSSTTRVQGGGGSAARGGVSPYANVRNTSTISIPVSSSTSSTTTTTKPVMRVLRDQRPMVSVSVVDQNRGAASVASVIGESSGPLAMTLRMADATAPFTPAAAPSQSTAEVQLDEREEMEEEAGVMVNTLEIEAAEDGVVVQVDEEQDDDEVIIASDDIESTTTNPATATGGNMSGEDNDDDENDEGITTSDVNMNGSGGEIDMGQSMEDGELEEEGGEDGHSMDRGGDDEAEIVEINDNDDDSTANGESTIGQSDDAIDTQQQQRQTMSGGMIDDGVIDEENEGVDGVGEEDDEDDLNLNVSSSNQRNDLDDSSQHSSQNFGSQQDEVILEEEDEEVAPNPRDDTETYESQNVQAIQVVTSTSSKVRRTPIRTPIVWNSSTSSSTRGIIGSSRSNFRSTGRRGLRRPFR